MNNKSALIIGTDSCANLGDQAILKTLVMLVQKHGFTDVHVASYRPELVSGRLGENFHLSSLVSVPHSIPSGTHHLRAIVDTSATYAFAKTRSKLGFAGALPKTDVAIFHGGRYLASPFFNAMWTTALVARQLAASGTKVILAPQTIGPASTIKEKIALSLVLKSADYVMARESETVEFLRHFNVVGPKYLSTPDVVYGTAVASPSDARQFLESHDVGRSGRPLVLVADRPLVGLAAIETIGEGAHLRAMAAVLDMASEQFELAFLSSTYASGSYKRDDPSQGRKLREMMEHPDRLPIIDSEPSSELLAACYGLADAVFTTRMHPIIMSSRMGTPVISLAYEPKCFGQLRLIGHPDWAFSLGSDPREVFDALATCVRDSKVLEPGLLARTSELAASVADSFDVALNGLNHEE